MEPAEDNFGDSTWSLVTTRALSLASTSTPAVPSASTINLVFTCFFSSSCSRDGLLGDDVDDKSENRLSNFFCVF